MLEILNVLKSGDEVKGYIIKDDDICYPVSVIGLRNRVLFDYLIDNGYTPCDTKGNWKLGSFSISDLPSKSWEEIVTDADVMQDIVDMENPDDLVSEEDVLKYIPKDMYQYKEWSTGDYRINTKEELIKFLNKDWSKVKGYLKWIPLNYITSPNALFTVAEFLKLPSKIKIAILNRRYLSFEEYLNLIDFLKQHGLGDKFETIDVIKSYFQWGIDGIRLNVYHESISQRYSEILSGVKNYNEITTYVDNNGDLCEEVKCYDKDNNLINKSIDNYSFEFSDSYYQDKVNKFMSKCEENEIMPIKVLTPKTHNMINWLFDGGLVEMTETGFCIGTSIDNKTYSNSYCAITLNVINPINPNVILSTEMLNVSNNNVLDTFKLQALARKIVDILKVQFNGTSYDALSTQSADVESVMRYVLTNPEYTVDENQFDMTYVKNVPDNVEYFRRQESMNNINNKGEISGVHIYNAIRYLLHDDNDNDYNPQGKQELLDYIEELLTIDIATDRLADGKARDELSNSIAEHLPYLTIIHYELGYSFSEIYEKISKDLNTNSPFLKFEGNGKIVKMDYLHVIDKAVSGYYEDISNYRHEAARANTLLYITNVYKELSRPKHGDMHRHIAVDGLRFPLRYETYNNGFVTEKENRDAISAWDYIYVKIKNYCENLLNDIEMSVILDKIPPIVSTAIFNVMISPEIDITSLFRDSNRRHTVVIEREVIDKIRNCMTEFVESIVFISNVNINSYESDKKFNYYVVNAEITPTHVIPHKGVSLNLYPFSAIWQVYSRDLEEARNDKIRKRKIPAKTPKGNDFFGYKSVYQVAGASSSLSIKSLFYFPSDYKRDSEWKIVDNGKNSYQVAAEDPLTLAFYWENSNKFKNEYSKNKELPNPPHPAEILYKEIRECLPDSLKKYIRDVDNITSEDREESLKGTNHLWGLNKDLLEQITYEDMIELYPEKKLLKTKKNVYMMTSNNNNTYQLPNTVNRIKSLNIETILHVENLNDKVFNNNTSRSRFVHVGLNKVAYLDGKDVKVIDINDIVNLSEDEYSIIKLSGREYLIEDIYNCKYIVLL